MNRLTAELREQTQQSVKLDADRKGGADPEDAVEYLRRQFGRRCGDFVGPVADEPGRIARGVARR